ncbi:hypothetical protein NLJ89_g367 [Agrocybe chaxingu]|uniref:Uncharacterized protein n=1 Tax=Agrocybe chaxingu TaxID=84603 RepID=A0A9W8N218_9AGAR|nr:hypothetical protein NLJ89_g367 [Agrocybe chaxingu]
MEPAEHTTCMSNANAAILPNAPTLPNVATSTFHNVAPEVAAPTFPSVAPEASRIEHESDGKSYEQQRAKERITLFKIVANELVG